MILLKKMKYAITIKDWKNYDTGKNTKYDKK